MDYSKFTQQIKIWGRELGFQDVGIADTQMPDAEKKLGQWLECGYHGNMMYMEKHGTLRTRPNELFPGTLRIITVTMNYYPANSMNPIEILQNADKSYVSRYALGRDYHKVMRIRLKNLQNRIAVETKRIKSRVYVDSAPVMEKELARQSGLGWIGKHTNLLNKKHGSWFFLGELFTNLPLTVDTPTTKHCGTCQACIDVCPTQAIIKPYVLDARKCISYLTIEYNGIIPETLRTAIGNRIYGCDDCQIWCPWNKFKTNTDEKDYYPRNKLDNISLLELFAWSETQFKFNLLGSPIRRIGYVNWLRNLSIAMGNATPSQVTLAALQNRLTNSSNPILKNHFEWAIKLQMEKLKSK